RGVLVRLSQISASAWHLREGMFLERRDCGRSAAPPFASPAAASLAEPVPRLPRRERSAASYARLPLLLRSRLRRQEPPEAAGDLKGGASPPCIGRRK